MTHQAFCGRWAALLSVSLAACVLDTNPGGVVDDSAGGSSDEGDGSTGLANDSDGTHGGSGGIPPECVDPIDCNHPELTCINGSCVPLGGGQSCVPGAVLPECGNGILEALEDCDGGANCDAQCTGLFAGEGNTVSLVISDVTTRPDGDYAVVGYDVMNSIALVITANVTDPGSAVTPVFEFVNEPASITTDPSGNIYVAGSRVMGNDSVAALVALDSVGNLLWTLDLGVGSATDVLAEDSGITVAGGVVNDIGDSDAVLWFVDPAGALVDTRSDGWLYVSSIARVGEDLVGATFASGEVGTLTRWDASGTTLWTAPVADEPDLAAALSTVVADGDDGTWSAGSTGLGPVVIHHDAEGSELERFNCLGGLSGHAYELAVSDTGRVALGLTYGSAEPIGHPWFAVITDHQIDFGYNPALALGGAPDSLWAATAGLHWMPDGSLLTVTADYFEGQSRWDVFFAP